MTVLEEIDQIRGYLSGPGQPFELIEQDVLGQKLPVYRHVPKNLSTIVTSAAAYGDREFMVNGDQRITFAQALAKAAGLATILKDRYGLVRIVTLPSGESIKDYESISFASMTEPDRAKFIDWSLTTLSKWLGVDCTDLRREADAA